VPVALVPARRAPDSPAGPLYSSSRVLIKSTPPGSPHRGPSERDAPLLEPHSSISQSLR
jgi:hypothetical protein